MLFKNCHNGKEGGDIKSRGYFSSDDRCDQRNDNDDNQSKLLRSDTPNQKHKDWTNVFPPICS